MNKDVCCRAVGKERARRANKKNLRWIFKRNKLGTRGARRQTRGVHGEGGRAYFKWRSILYPLLTGTYFCFQISRFSPYSSAPDARRGALEFLNGGHSSRDPARLPINSRSKPPDPRFYRWLIIRVNRCSQKRPRDVYVSRVSQLFSFYSHEKEENGREKEREDTKMQCSGILKESKLADFGEA